MKIPLPRDSLTTTSAGGKRISVFPASVKGVWSQRRFWFHWMLIAVYLVLPWLRVGGHPMILLDVEHRRFSLFGQLFFAQEVPSMVFLAFAFLFWVAWMTAWFGRAWCGWACPQTVFIERIFRLVQKMIEGDHVKQKALAIAPMSPGKIGKMTAKWAVFMAIALVLSHSFLAYFVGSAESFAWMTRSPAEHPGSFFMVLLFSGVVLFDFGWFREQFCLVACPYGRFQSVMMDDSSLFIHYDQRRPDCIDCWKCVSACPTGIDIRNGLQMECIACAACVDACDGVMRKIRKPPGLISYQSISSLQGRAFRVFRGRPVVYGLLFFASVGILSARLSGRMPYSFEAVRAVDAPYQVVEASGGSAFVLNHFRVRIGNQGWADLDPGIKIEAEGTGRGVELILPPGSVSISSRRLHSGEASDFDLFLKIPREAFKGTGPRSTRVIASWGDGLESRHDLQWIGPRDDL